MHGNDFEENSLQRVMVQESKAASVGRGILASEASRALRLWRDYYRLMQHNVCFAKSLVIFHAWPRSSTAICFCALDGKKLSGCRLL